MIAYLPPELYSAILDQVPASCLQHTVLSLTRSLPSSPIPQQHLFRSIRITRPEQIIQLYRRLRAERSAAKWVHAFSQETWNADAEIVNAVIAMLTELKVLRVCVGPTNYTPEHLAVLVKLEEDEERWSKLASLEIRFRPYVQKATYQQFLKGSYFDGTLHALALWPHASLTTLSIVQDPMDPSLLAPSSKKFAQPIVFFRLDPISTLLRSPALSNLTSFRFRLPSRQISAFIVSGPPPPNVEVLDLSTANVLEIDVDGILVRFTDLKHLILDDCAILRGAEIREGEWASLGKKCALAGVKRAREREKKIRTWLEENPDNNSNLTDNGPPPPTLGHATRRPRKGRRGLATATISLRDHTTSDQAGTSLTSVVVRPPPGLARQKIRILPPSPTLESLATTVFRPDTEKHDAIRSEWEKGWAEGLAQIMATRRRLYQSARNGVRVMRFVDDEDERGEDGLDGLEDVKTEAEWGLGESELKRAPVLCLAGHDGKGSGTSGLEFEHEKGCGHEFAKGLWE